jgi:hypothetical protein
LPKYRTLRLREDDFQRLRDLQRLLRQRGTDSINWKDLLDVPQLDEVGEDDESSDLTWGIILGLGAAALGYHLWKNAKDQERR